MTAKELGIKLLDYPANSKISLEELKKVLGEDKKKEEEEINIVPQWKIYVEYYPFCSTRTCERIMKTKPTEDDIKWYLERLKNREHIKIVEVRKNYIGF